MKTATENTNESREKSAAYISLAVSTALLVAKFWIAQKTGSQAVLSDAMESIANVSAGLLALFVIYLANKPADLDHPYGHGKVEFFSAAFEGGLIAFASGMIIFQASRSWINPQPLRELELGTLALLGAGFVNFGLGLYLVWAGKKYQSIALAASGHHIMTDFYTSLAVVAGLVFVGWTGEQWVDGLLAFTMGCVLAWTGYRLVRRSVAGLLDEQDLEALKHLQDLLRDQPEEGIIQLHHCRIIRSGRYHHIDAHVVVPEFWNVLEAHNRTESYEDRLMKEYRHRGELHFHVDPCRQAYCRVCNLAECPVRRQPFEERHLPTLEELTDPEEPAGFRPRNA